MKTSELIGPALDWAVAKCEANAYEVFVIKGCIDHIHSYVGGSRNDSDTFIHEYSPSTNWAQGGPIIERELIDVATKFINATVDHPNGQWGWQASCVTEDYTSLWFDGPTPLIAALRCYVASKLGDEVDIPEELSGENHASTS